MRRAVPGRLPLSRRALLAGLGAAGAAAVVGRRFVTADTLEGARLLIPGLSADSVQPAGPSLREMIGQMVLVGFRGLTLDTANPIGAGLAVGRGAGAILFSYDVGLESPVRNVQSPAQVAALTGQVRGLAGPRAFTAIDQEGGVVARLSPQYGFPATQSAAVLGAIDDTDVTYEAAAAIASTLASVGLNLNFAPVVDVNVNPGNPVIGALDRSFSADPATVTRHAEAFIRAHHDHGVLCAIKHFPGHGSSTEDSHDGFVDVSDTWSEAEMEPFAAITRDGLADIVMTAHIFNRHLDADFPATLSHATVTGLLRGELGYEGVIVSDDMEMGAITQQFGFETAIERAINAGIDLLLYGNNLADYDATLPARVVETIETLVEDGTVPEARIRESYGRIMALKGRLPS